MTEQASEAENQESELTPEPKAKKKKGGSDDPLTIFMHWCKGCGICIELCPHKVFTTDKDGKPIVSSPRECTQCALCWLHCPDLAIISNEK